MWWATYMYCYYYVSVTSSECLCDYSARSLYFDHSLILINKWNCELHHKHFRNYFGSEANQLRHHETKWTVIQKNDKVKKKIFPRGKKWINKQSLIEPQPQLSWGNVSCQSTTAATTTTTTAATTTTTATATTAGLSPSSTCRRRRILAAPLLSRSISLLQSSWKTSLNDSL